MPDVKRNALLPKGEENGLAGIARELIDDPARYRAAIVILDCKRVTIDQDTREEVATIRIRRAEVVLPDDLAAAEQLIRRALEFRTGQTTLPLELEDELEQAFREMTDPDSPEDPGDGQGGKGTGKGGKP
jgi:hypothetical protein